MIVRPLYALQMAIFVSIVVTWQHAEITFLRLPFIQITGKVEKVAGGAYSLENQLSQLVINVTAF